MYVYMQGCVNAGYGVPVDAKGQPHWQQFSPPAFSWVTGNKFMQSHSKCLYLLNHFVVLWTLSWLMVISIPTKVKTQTHAWTSLRNSTIGQVWVEIRKHSQTQRMLAWDPRVSENLQPVLMRTKVRSQTIFYPRTSHTQQPQMTFLLQHLLKQGKPRLSRHRALSI